MKNDIFTLGHDHNLVFVILSLKLGISVISGLGSSYKSGLHFYFSQCWQTIKIFRAFSIFTISFLVLFSRNSCVFFLAWNGMEWHNC